MRSILQKAFYTRKCPRCDGRGIRFTWKGGGRGSDGRGVAPRWDEKWEQCWECQGAGRVALSEAEAKKAWRTRLKHGGWFAALWILILIYLLWRE